MGKIKFISACLLTGIFLFAAANFLDGRSEASANFTSINETNAVPLTFTYHGYLEDNDAPANGSYSMVFRLYNSSSGGSSQGQQSFGSVTVTDGIFSVDLNFSSSVWDASNVYVEVTVDGNVMSPRQRVTAVPYAIQAGSIHWDDVTNKPNIGGGGSDGTDHNHVGQVWSGSQAGGAILELSNTSTASRSSALYISDAGDDGIRIHIPNGESAVWVENTGENGVQVDEAGHSGVYVRNANHYGIWVVNEDNGMRDAARFDGDVIITGSICTSVNGDGTGGNCQAAGSVIEGQALLNPSQAGNITLDENGEATITLPADFTAAYSDFSYQLTPIGAFSPVFIAEEIQGNAFKISGGSEGVKVSWQVVGLTGSDQ